MDPQKKSGKKANAGYNDDANQDDEDWATGWSRWSDYRAQYKTGEVPSDYHDRKLVNWVERQRADYAKFRKGRSTFLSEDGFRMLSRMGFCWGSRNDEDDKQEENEYTHEFFKKEEAQVTAPDGKPEGKELDIPKNSEAMATAEQDKKETKRGGKANKNQRGKNQISKKEYSNDEKKGKEAENGHQQVGVDTDADENDEKASGKADETDGENVETTRINASRGKFRNRGKAGKMHTEANEDARSTSDAGVEDDRKPAARGTKKRGVGVAKAVHDVKKALRSVTSRKDNQTSPTRTNFEEEWEKNFQMVLDFKRNQGQVNMISRRGELGKWLAKVRSYYDDYKKSQPNPLTAEHVEMLREVGFNFVGGVQRNENAFTMKITPRKRKAATQAGATLAKGQDRVSSKSRKSAPNSTEKTRAEVSTESESSGRRRSRRASIPVARLVDGEETKPLEANLTEPEGKDIPRRRAIATARKNMLSDPPEEKFVGEDPSIQIIVKGAPIMTVGEYRKFREPIEPMTQERGLSEADAERNRQWFRMFLELVDFKVTEGHVCVPKHPSKSFKIEWHALSSWVYSQRQKKREKSRGSKVTLSRARIKRLTEIGFEWNTRNSAAFWRNQSDLHGSTEWENRFKMFLEFKEKYGHVMVPKVFPENQKLSYWVCRQRSQRKLKLQGRPHPGLSPEREERLTKAGFVWSGSTKGNRNMTTIRKTQASWIEKFKTLQAFQKKHGHTWIPKRWKQDPMLASWVARMRTFFRQRLEGRDNPLINERFELLKSIGFEFELDRENRPSVADLEVASSDEEENDDSSSDTHKEEEGDASKPKITVSPTQVSPLSKGAISGESLSPERDEDETEDEGEDEEAGLGDSGAAYVDVVEKKTIVPLSHCVKRASVQPSSQRVSRARGLAAKRKKPLPLTSKPLGKRHLSGSPKRWPDVSNREEKNGSSLQKRQTRSTSKSHYSIKQTSNDSADTATAEDEDAYGALKLAQTDPTASEIPSTSPLSRPLQPTKTDYSEESSNKIDLEEIHRKKRARMTVESDSRKDKSPSMTKGESQPGKSSSGSIPGKVPSSVDEKVDQEDDHPRNVKAMVDDPSPIGRRTRSCKEVSAPQASNSTETDVDKNKRSPEANRSSKAKSVKSTPHSEPAAKAVPLKGESGSEEDSKSPGAKPTPIKHDLLMSLGACDADMTNKELHTEGVAMPV